jgi:hypothetical protein
MASKRYNDRDEPDNGTAKKSQNVLLDINPEGELLREINDIVDELFIMMQIKTQEETVARTFVKQYVKLCPYFHRFFGYRTLGGLLREFSSSTI